MPDFSEPTTTPEAGWHPSERARGTATEKLIYAADNALANGPMSSFYGCLQRARRPGGTRTFGLSKAVLFPAAAAATALGGVSVCRRFKLSRNVFIGLMANHCTPQHPSTEKRAISHSRFARNVTRSTSMFGRKLFL